MTQEADNCVVKGAGMGARVHSCEGSPLSLTIQLPELSQLIFLGLTFLISVMRVIVPALQTVAED